MIIKLGFIFTNFNNTKFTESAIKSISESDAKYAPVIIVDNASKQEHVIKLRSIANEYNNVKLICNVENIGYFKGLNVGIKLGKNQYPQVKYWIIGNNDLTFSKDILAQVLSNQSILNDYPVISPNIITIDGIPQNPHVISKISKFREVIYDLYHFNYYLAGFIKKLAKFTHRYTDRDDEAHHEEAMEIYQGYGACYILTPTFFENFEELWSPTFLMYEEFFLSKQLEEKGYKIFYEPSIRIQHHWHATTTELPKRLYWEFSRNAHKEYRKHIKLWK